MKVSVKEREFFYKTKSNNGEVNTISIIAENRTAADKSVKENYSDFKTKFVYMSENTKVYEISVEDVIAYGMLIEDESDF